MFPFRSFVINSFVVLALIASFSPCVYASPFFPLHYVMEELGVSSASSAPLASPAAEMPIASPAQMLAHVINADTDDPSAILSGVSTSTPTSSPVPSQSANGAGTLPLGCTGALLGFATTIVYLVL
ncbi:hypothetical protein B0H21DRAFT_825996 [Amylocystis lapponica]|nr:hypothetical protein B0H21DRAFT_825996 [Amylocystis lapponica]